MKEFYLLKFTNVGESWIIICSSWSIIIFPEIAVLDIFLITRSMLYYCAKSLHYRYHFFGCLYWKEDLLFFDEFFFKKFGTIIFS